MTTVKVNIHSSNGISTEIVGRGKGTITAERNPRIGTQGGRGYGGGEILCMAAGTCFYNNVKRLANDKHIVLKTIEIEVVAETSDSPPETREVTLKPTIESDADESTIHALIEQAFQESYVAGMLRNPVSVKLG
jgi:uncharacterized OsmC-like protein